MQGQRRRRGERGQCDVLRKGRTGDGASRGPFGSARGTKHWPISEILDKWWEWYCRGIEAMDNNPAPGNKAGGITTVFEKSLGGVTKGGTTPLMDVFLYGEPITTRGFVFMDTPGHDPVSITGLVAGGCNVICFTTGRGSVFGCKPCPPSSWPPTRSCTATWRRTWTSTVA